MWRRLAIPRPYLLKDYLHDALESLSHKWRSAATAGPYLLRWSRDRMLRRISSGSRVRILPGAPAKRPGRGPFAALFSDLHDARPPFRARSLRVLRPRFTIYAPADRIGGGPLPLVAAMQVDHGGPGRRVAHPVHQLTHRGRSGRHPRHRSAARDCLVLPAAASPFLTLFVPGCEDRGERASGLWARAALGWVCDTVDPWLGAPASNIGRGEEGWRCVV